MPRNAFLDHRVSTVEDLLDQVRTSPKVLSAYTRHFGMTENQLLHYFGEFHVAALRTPVRTSVFAVLPSGVIRTHVEVLKPGTKVFANQNGVPQLLVSCGNPLTLGPEPDGSSLVPNQVFSGTVNPTVREIAADTITPKAVVTANDFPQPDLINDETPPVIAQVPQNPVTPPVKPPPAERQSFGNALPLVGLIGGGIFFGVGHGSSHTQPAPEPSQLIFIGLTCASLLLLKKKR